MPATASSTERVTIRTAAEVGPAAMAEWINLFHWNPGPLGGAPLTAQDYAAFIRDRGAIETLLAMDGERIVGSLALYPVSAMKAGHGSVVWMDTFAIHPDYRLGTIPIRLFVAAFVLCVTRGYDRIDCNASPANPSMVAIVRPAGFKQASPALRGRPAGVPLLPALPLPVHRRVARTGRAGGSDGRRVGRPVLEPVDARAHLRAERGRGCRVAPRRARVPLPHGRIRDAE